MSLSGGFHHAFPDWAEGFCYINDVAVGVRAMRDEGQVERAMVVDCDLHQGNGTAVIFQDDPSALTFSIHEQNIYPLKRESDVDVGLPSFCSGRAYCDELRMALVPALDRHRPELVVYVAGADPFERDQLGTLQLTLQDMRERDDIVIGSAVARGVPVAVVLAGGYSPDVRDTVSCHYQTACAAAEHARAL
jgi:acetoin utilization deacetylase AcuC-like enzyme